MVVQIDPQDTLVDVITKVNAEIDGRRQYGMRREILPTTKRASVCTWSNGQSRWFCGTAKSEVVCEGGSTEFQAANEALRQVKERCKYDEVYREAADLLRELKRREGAECRERKAKSQCLDANEIAVVGIKSSTLAALAPLLNNLPLYGGSFEARGGGEFTLKGIDIPPGIRSVPADTLDPRTLEALIERAMEE